jgi:hypothetical protein
MLDAQIPAAHNADEVLAAVGRSLHVLLAAASALRGRTVRVRRRAARARVGQRVHRSHAQVPHLRRYAESSESFWSGDFLSAEPW